VERAATIGQINNGSYACMPLVRIFGGLDGKE